MDIFTMSDEHIVLEPMNEGEPLKKGPDIGATRMEELEHELSFIATPPPQTLSER